MAQEQKKKKGGGQADLDELPKATINRIIKQSLEDNMAIQSDAKLAIQKAATVFIHYLTACANEHCHQSNRQTISPADINAALEDMDMGHYKLEVSTAFEACVQEHSEQTRRKKEKDAEKLKTVLNEVDMIEDQDVI